jgi:hypothetical protein
MTLEELAAAFSARRCSICGGSGVVSVYAGTEPDRVMGAGTLPLDSGLPERNTCLKCLIVCMPA